MINPQSTSYPVLATIQALGITNPAVQTAMYEWADALAQANRGWPRADHELLRSVSLVNEAEKTTVYLSMDIILPLEANLERAYQWCLDDIAAQEKATKARLQREARNERKRLTRAAAREQAALDRAEAEEDARLVASVRSNNVSEHHKH